VTDDSEALRRRLYRPGAGEHDVAAYLGAADRPVPPPPAPAATRPRRTLRGLLLVVGVVLPALVAAPLLDRTSPTSPEGVPAAVRRPATATPTPLPTSSVDPATRAAFVRKVALGGDAGLAPWWDAGPGVVEVHGTGSTTVRLPVPVPHGTGHLTVLLVLGSDGTARWTAARFVIHDDRTVHLAPVGGASGSLRAGIPTAGRVDYTAATRPQRVLLAVPSGAEWGLAVVDSVDTRPPPG
jgi:hypothetical protein